MSALFKLSALFVMLSLAPALAATGTAVGVNPEATAQDKETVRTLVVGSDVAIGERVITGPKGQVEFIFSDKTRLVVGPGSSLVIEDYLLRNETTASKVTVNALAGTFRFVTGKSPKSAYQIKTPTGTIGVRGTGFDFSVLFGATSVLLYHGAVNICSNSGKCVVLTAKCEAGIYNSTDSVVLGADGKFEDSFKAQFPYARNERPLRREFWIADARTCLIEPDPGLPPPSLGGAGPRSGGGSGAPVPPKCPPFSTFC